MKKLKFGEGGLKGLLAQHAEKLLLGLAALLTLLLIWSGFAHRQSIDPGKDPARLKQEITQATSHIESFGWETHFKESRDLEQNFLNRAQETLQRMEVEAYQMPQLVKPPYYPPRTMRTDPDLFPPFELQARAGYGSLSLAREQAQDEVFQEQQSRFRGSPLGEGMRGGQAEQEDGTRPIPTGTFGGRTEGGNRFGNMGKRVGRHFVAVTGLIPLRKQLEAYNESLGNSADYSPSRDFPNVLTWKLQRAEVRGGNDQQLRWKDLASLKKAVVQSSKWGVMNTARPLIDPQAFGRVVTSPLPPIEAENLDKLMRHDKIEPYTEQRFNMRGDMLASSRESQDVEPDELAGGLSWGGGGGRGRGMMGGDMYMPRGGPGPMMDMPMRPMGDGGRGMMDEGYSPMMDRPYGADDGGGMTDNPYGGGGGFGGRGGVGSGGIVDPEQVSEYQMFRYIDFAVTPGKKYCYRLMLKMIDPNSPSQQYTPPVSRSLDTSVASRIAKNILPEKLAKQYGVKHKFWRDTDWSEPSNVVFVSSGNRLLVGEATTVKPVRTPDGTFVKAGDGPSAKVLALDFDREMATEVPCEITVHQGTVANFVKTVEAPLWDEGILKEIENRPFRLNSVVLDIEGGQSLQVGKLKAPTELLVWNEAGTMEVIDELGSLDDYQRFTFPPEDKTTTGRGTMMDGPGAFDGEMYDPRGGGDDGGRRGSNRRGRSRRGNERGGRGGDGER